MRHVQFRENLMQNSSVPVSCSSTVDTCDLKGSLLNGLINCTPVLSKFHLKCHWAVKNNYKQVKVICNSYTMGCPPVR